MSDRANALADQFEQAHGELVGMLDGLRYEQWQSELDGEGWPISVGACHIAEHYTNWRYSWISPRTANQFPTGRPKAPQTSISLTPITAHNAAAGGRKRWNATLERHSNT